MTPEGARLGPFDLSETIRRLQRCFRAKKRKTDLPCVRQWALSCLAEGLFFDLFPRWEDLEEDEKDDEGQDEEGEGDEEPFKTA